MKLRSYILAAIAVIATAALAVQAQVPGVNSTLNSVFTLVYDASTMKPTYSATSAFSPTATAATDVCILNGSATKTIKVRRIYFNALATTAVSDPIAIIKRSTANSGGTSVGLSEIALDSTSAAASAAALTYTANPTVGTAVGTIADPYFSIGNLTTGGAQAFPSQLLFGELGSPIVLRGAAQSVAVNLNAASFPGIVASCTFEWTED
jgi:hypothetical protein